MIKTFSNSGKNSITLPASQLPTGIYIIRMQSGNQSATVKTVKLQ
ncbi:MAG: T9SS type A sorting domain-containing protein [Chitinophagaceae bacterium]|nr:T9SS type A sorting domain-containing protein [Chitinophagaceae bacterium]